MNIKYDYDVIVVGGGHAGVEAALASAKMGARTAMFIIKYESIGRMSCNPSIGGPAKGHLAREIDALGGEMGRATDLSGIQFRMLNKKKGPAVWAPRSQNDRQLYSKAMMIAVQQQSGLEVKESEIVELLYDTGAIAEDSYSLVYESSVNMAGKLRVTGVRSNLGENYYAPKVIVSAGTFLKGVVHIGSSNYKAGRAGEPSAEYLSGSLEKLGFQLGRFKTGTPPRIDMNSLNYNLVEPQPGDEPPQGFSFYSDMKLKNIVTCYLTYTNPSTHKIITDNLQLSALYSGNIIGRGPRYCPSIEDKIVRFSDKDMHHIFIEPEGVDTIEGYVNGISTSLPANVQKEILKSIPALEHAKVIRYGYAIDYDYLLPGQIKFTMEAKNVQGLYFAGQINGTSGYEEAAAQGLIAGVNAVLSLDKKEPFILSRSSSYIGVLIDDLITKGTNEPYRMFTSRAEYRLSLRQDNADERLMPVGYMLGLVSQTRYGRFLTTKQIIEREIAFLKKNNTKIVRQQQTNLHNEDLNILKSVDTKEEPTRLANVLKRPNITLQDLQAYGYELPNDITPEIWERIALEIKYEGYLKRQEADIQRFQQFEDMRLPEVIDYDQIKTISMEAREKLKKIRPVSIGQASRISGVNFTDISALLIYIRKNCIDDNALDCSKMD
jgi:tRNA uridine 5-carboxymethylaminomethyl modification enzyme